MISMEHAGNGPLSSVPTDSKAESGDNRSFTESSPRQACVQSAPATESEHNQFNTDSTPRLASVHIISAKTDFYKPSARDVLHEVFKDTSIVGLANCECLASFPKFEQSELVQDKVLGRGSFGIVKEIKKVDILLKDSASQVSDHSTNVAEGDIKNDDEHTTVRKKHLIATQCIREGGNARYAVKSIQEISDPDVRLYAIVDLAVETRILSIIEHPNIIKMRGISAADICSSNHFLVLDRLYDTLQERLETWKKKYKKSRSMVGKLRINKVQLRNELLDERLQVLFDLASALHYLHSRRIMHRDLKPDNMGFDIRGDVKIFDFGLAKDLPPKNGFHSETYELSGQTGSMRYMAPEVYHNKPYNEKADVYSFGILLWQILAFKIPFECYTADDLDRYVFKQGLRPTIKPAWSEPIQSIMRSCWTPIIKERSTAGTCERVLKMELSKHRGGDETGLEHARRRSTFY